MKIYLTVFIGFFVLSCSNGQAIVAINGLENTAPGINKEQIAQLFNKIKIFPDNTELSIALIKNGKATFVGIKRTNDTIRFVENNQHIFEIGSISKVFTATLLSNFAIQEKLKIDDNVQEYLEFQIKAKEKITFVALSNHTSGLPRLPSNLNLSLVDPDNPYKDYDEKKLINYLTSFLRLNQKPSTTYEYSNLGAGVLGYVLAKTSSSSYENLLQEKIFKKYSMFNSTSNGAHSKSNLVRGLKPNGEITSNWDFDVLAGAGAIRSTTEDLSKFALAQFNENNRELALTQKPTFQVNENMSLGLGWHILKRKKGKQFVWHNGGTGGYTSSMALNVPQKNGIIILSNVSAFNEKMNTIDQLCFGLMNTLDKK